MKDERTQQEIDADREDELASELRTLLDYGLEKHAAGDLVKIIKGLAVIAVREAEEEARQRSGADATQKEE